MRPARILEARTVLMRLLPVLMLLVSACTQGRPVKIVRVDRSTVVGTLVEMRPDAVELATASGTRVAEPRAGIASIDLPSEPELAALRDNESRRAGGSDTGTTTGAGGAANGGDTARSGDASGRAGDRSQTAGGDPGGGGASKDAPFDPRRANPGGGASGSPNGRDDPRTADRSGAGAGTSTGGSNAGSSSSMADGRAEARSQERRLPDGRPSDRSPSDGGGQATSARGSGVVIPANTVLALSLDAPLDSDSTRPEERVDATLTAPVIVDRTTLLPAGTRLRGDLIEAVSAKEAGGRGRLAIRFHTLVLGSDAIPITAAPLRFVAGALTRDDAKNVGFGAAAGALFGGLFSKTKKGLGMGAAAGGGATAIVVSRNNEMHLNRGTSLRVRLTEPVPLRAR